MKVQRRTGERTLAANKYTGLAFVLLFCTVVEDDINTSVSTICTQNTDKTNPKTLHWGYRSSGGGGGPSYGMLMYQNLKNKVHQFKKTH